MKRSRVSELWKFFKVESEEKKTAKCNVCHMSLSFKGTVSNLNKHLKNRHLITFTTTTAAKAKSQRQEDNITRRLTEVSESGSNADVQEICSDTADDVTPSTSSQTSGPISQATNPSSSKVQQPITMFSNVRKLSTKQRKDIDEALMLLFYKNFHPFSMVEDKYFKNFIAKLNPAYQLPSRKHVSKVLLDADFHTCSNEVKEKLKSIESVCLTIDCWTSQAQEGYLAVTGHYLANFSLEAILLQCRVLKGPHTAANLSLELDQVIRTWNLQKKVQLVVADNATNIQNSIRDLNLKSFGCFAHTINLIAKDSLKIPNVENVLQKIRSIASHFRRSTNATEKLLRYQVNNEVSNPKKMVIDVATRWNSTFHMLERALYLKEAISSTLGILESASSASLENLNADEWKLCTDMCTVLKPLEQVTVEISGEKYMTGSLVIIFNRLLYKAYGLKLAKDKELHTSAKDICDNILTGLASRLKNIEQSMTFATATILDPRFKMAYFLDKERGLAAKQNLIDLVITEINRQWARESAQSQEVNQPNVEAAEENTNRPYKVLDIWADLDAQVTHTLESPRAIAIAEVQRYLNAPMLDRNLSPTDWWRKNNYLYPNLTRVFNCHGCVLATSVPCERIFSKTGEHISDRRTSLSSEKVKKIMFLHVNRK